MTPGYISILLHSSIFSNKTLESCNIWVNSRELSFCATHSPGHNADKLSTKNQRSARITLARVFTTTRHTSTDHVDSDSTVIDICTIAFCTFCDEYFDCLELWRIYATWTESSPTTDYSKGTSRRFCGSQRNWLNSCSVGEWNRYLKWNTEIIEVFYWKVGCLPRMFCLIVYHWMICIQLYTIFNFPILLQYVEPHTFVFLINVG